MSSCLSCEFVDEDLAGVKRIREIFGDRIPAVLDTDFNLRRWWRGNQGRMVDIERKMNEYLENRRVLEFDREDFVSTFYEKAENREVLRFFRMFRIDPSSLVNRDNGFVFVEGGRFDTNVVRAMTTGKYLRVYFRCCELLLRLILEQERISGRPSHGICIFFGYLYLFLGICIFDIGSFELANQLNPLSACSRVFQTRSRIWLDFYPEMMSRVVIVNPPIYIGIIWNLIRILLNEQAQRLILFANKKDILFSVVDRRLVPVAFGGDYRDKSGWSTSDDGCSENCPVADADLYIDGTIWRRIGIVLPSPMMKTIQIHVKPGRMHRIICSPQNVDNDEHCRFVVGWHFWTSGEMHFAVRKDPGHLIYQSCRVVTTKVAEEDLIECNGDDRIWMEMANVGNHYFAVNIDLVLFSSAILQQEDLSLPA